MKNQKSRLQIPRPSLIRRGLDLPTVVRTFLLAGMVIVGCMGFVQQVEAAQSAASYCGQYGSNALKNACKAGLKGDDCSDYAITFDQSTADICTKATNDKKAGLVTDGEVKVTPSPSVSPNTGSQGQSNFDKQSFQDIMDESDSLSEYVDMLHELGPNADANPDEEPDNTPGSYVNGAGKKQPIEILTPGTGNSPAILFFNGGGWHSNDKTGQAVASGSPMKNGLSGGRHIGPPDGGSSAQRGYAAFDVTYRLGSSGVYYMFEDVMRGIQHVRNNAGLYGIDPSRIVLWGDSAGGSLVMRAAASGKSGAKAAVGWSAPTNAFTALFKSYKSLMIGMDHSTCVPTDLAGMTNFTDLLNGGSGEVAEYGQGLSSNDFSGLGIVSGPEGMQFNKDSIGLGTIMEVLSAGQYAMQTSQNLESISQQLEASKGDGMGGLSGMSGSLVNLSSKKLIECMDNFEALSPALFASPDTPPSVLAGFETDDLIDPSQAYEMRDKLRTLGIRSEAIILPGDAEAGNQAFGASENHLGYDPRFVCETINFLDEIVQPEKGKTDCKSGVAENEASAGGNEVANTGGGGDSSGGSSSGGGGGSSNNSGSGGGGQPAPAASGGEAGCKQNGGTWKMTAKGGGYCAPAKVCDTWDSRCNGGNALPNNNPNQICNPGQIYVYQGPGQTAGCRSSCPAGYVNKGTYCARRATGT